VRMPGLLSSALDLLHPFDRAQAEKRIEEQRRQVARDLGPLRDLVKSAGWAVMQRHAEAILAACQETINGSDEPELRTKGKMEGIRQVLEIPEDVQRRAEVILSREEA